MIVGGVGGANTQTGIRFEKDTDLEEAISAKEGFEIIDSFTVRFNGEIIGYVLQKHELYRRFLEPKKVDWKSIISKKLLPDDAYFSLKSNTLTIVEKKFQQVAGSVDEKLQTCGFKKRQYERLCSPLKNVKVEYVYILNDWFKHPSYKDVLDYIEEIDCKYYFDELPLNLLDI